MPGTSWPRRCEAQDLGRKDHVLARTGPPWSAAMSPRSAVDHYGLAGPTWYAAHKAQDLATGVPGNPDGAQRWEVTPSPPSSGAGILR